MSDPIKLFTFSYAENHDAGPDFPLAENLQANLTFSYDTPWTSVLDSFIKFLGACYGYDISEEVDYMTYGDKLKALKERLNDEEEHTDWATD